MPREVPADELAARVTRSRRNRLMSADSEKSRSQTPVNEISPILEKEKKLTPAKSAPTTKAARKGSPANVAIPAKTVSRGRNASLSEVDTKSAPSPARRYLRAASVASEKEATTSSRKSPLMSFTPIEEENENVEMDSSAKRRALRSRKVIKDNGNNNQEAEKSDSSLKNKKSPNLTSSEAKKASSSDNKNRNRKMIIQEQEGSDKRKKEYNSKTKKNTEKLEQTGKEDKNTIIIEKIKSETKSINESEKDDDKKDAEEEIPFYVVENTNKNNVTQIEENENILISQKENEKQNEGAQTADKDKGQEDVEKLKSVLEESIVNKDDNTQEDLNMEKFNVVEDTEICDIVMNNINSPGAQNKNLKEIPDSYFTEQSQKNPTEENEDKSKKQKSVSFGTNNTDKKSTNYPKTPLMVKSKSYTESRSISLRYLDTSHDTDTSTDVSALSKESNEKSQENSNSEKIDESVFHDSETPYKGPRGKSSLSSSTPIATVKNPIENDNKNVENLKQDKTILPNPITKDSQINEVEKSTSTLKEDIKNTSKSVTAAAKPTFQNENESIGAEHGFSKTWSQSVTVNVTDDAQKGKYIDGFGVQTENKKEVITTKLSGEKKATERTLHSDSESYEESDIDEDNEPRNEFIDDEAEEAEEENSLCSEERAYLEENEVPVDGISIGSADTDADNEEEEDECDSFIVSDREEDDDLLSYDTEEILSNSDDISVKGRKQKRRAEPLCESSDEESDADASKPDMMDSVLKKAKKRSCILISSDEEEKCEKDSAIPNTAASEKTDKINLTLKDRKIALETISEDNETSQTSDINNDTENVDECISAELVAEDLGSAKESESKDESTQVDIELPLTKTTSTTQTSPETEKEGNDIKLLEASEPSSFIQGGNSLDENAQEKELTVEEDCTNKEVNRKLSFSSEQPSNSISPNNSANLPASTAGQNANISILNVNESSLTIQENITETSMCKSKESELLASVDVEEEDSSVSTSEKSRKSQSTSSKNPSKDIQNDKSGKVSSPCKEDGLKPSEKKQTETTNTEDELKQKKTLEISVSNKEISSSNEELEQREQPSTSTLNNEEETTSVLNSAEVNEKDVADVNIQSSSFKNNSLNLSKKRKLFSKHKVLSSSFDCVINNKGSNSQDSTESEEDISIKPVLKKLKRSSLSQSLNQTFTREKNDQTDTSKSSTDEENEIDKNKKETIPNESIISFTVNESDFPSSSKIKSRSLTEFDRKLKEDSNKKSNLSCEDYRFATTSKSIPKNDDLKNAATSCEKFSPNLESIRSTVIRSNTETGDDEKSENWQQVDDSNTDTSSLSEEEVRLIQHIERMKKKRTEKQIEELSIENLQIPEDKEKRKAISKALEFGMFLLKKQVVDLTTVAKCGNATTSELALINRTKMQLKKLKKAKELANDQSLLQKESAFSVYSDEQIQLVPDSLIEALDREQHNGTRVAIESNDSSCSASIRKRKRNKRKVIAKTSPESSPEINGKVIKTSSGTFCEEPSKLKRNRDNKSKSNKKNKILSTIELPTGVVYEQPLTPIRKKIVNGFQETVATPRAIGFKISNLLPAGQKETPEYRPE